MTGRQGNGTEVSFSASRGFLPTLAQRPGWLGPEQDVMERRRVVPS